MHHAIGGCDTCFVVCTAADYCRQLRSEVRELDLEAVKLCDEMLLLSADIK